MTINEAIAQADGLKDNPFSEEIKAVWVNQVEETVQRSIFGVKEPRAFQYPEDGDEPLSVTGAFEVVYVYYIASMCDLWSGDISKYNVSARMYEETLDSFHRQYRRENPRDSRWNTLM